MADTFDVGFIIRYGNIPRNGIGEEIPLLHYRTALASPPAEIIFIQIGTADLNASFQRFIEPQQEFNECGLSASTRPHDCGYFAVRYGEIDV